MTAPIQPVAPDPMQAAPPALLPPPVAPWTPFAPLPTDDEPLVAQYRMRRLAKLIDSAKFESYPPEWQQAAIMEYQRMRQAVVAAQVAAQPAPAPGKGAPGKPDAANPNAQAQHGAQPAVPPTAARPQ